MNIDLPVWAWWAIANSAVVIGYVILGLDELDTGEDRPAWVRPAVVAFCTLLVFCVGALFIAFAHVGERTDPRKRGPRA